MLFLRLRPRFYNMRHRCKNLNPEERHLQYSLSDHFPCAMAIPAVSPSLGKNIVDTVTSHSYCMSLGRSALNHRFFLRCGVTRPNTLYSATASLKISSDVNVVASTYLSAFFKSGTLCNRRDRHRIITGNDLKIYLLAFKECQCIWCFLSDHISS